MSTTSEEPEKYIELLNLEKEVLSIRFDRTRNYANIVIGAGYVGIFTSASHLKDKISTSTFAIVMLFASISLVSFVIFEIWKITATSLQISSDYRRLTQAKRPGPKLFFMRKIENITMETTLKVISVWPIFLIVTLTTGFISAGIVLLCYIYLSFS
ncbi:hypothetical protein [Roseibium polysiphoniae]|uniref:hypothetical protein n=1 Tax=Roseibium polysiphoniae TaxID=2571221 RepID=UPI001BCB8D74|nr:hypothetical protein [Roseibium polysiphoniae]